MGLPSLLRSASASASADAGASDDVTAASGRGIPYGVGLELECATKVPAYVKRTRHSGHAGTTYGFQSIIGYYPDLGMALGVVINSDHTFNKRVVVCNLVQLIMVHKGAPASLDLECDAVAGQMGCNYTAA